jgi:hypothetical protein
MMRAPGPPACVTRRLNPVLTPEKGYHMIHRSSRRAVHCTAFVSLLLCIVTLLCAVGNTFAAVVGDQIELKATHQAGVPLHQEPRGTNDFQRVPDGTRATVIEVAPDGRWVKLSLVWSKNSCGFMRVVFQEPPEPFSTVN